MIIVEGPDGAGKSTLIETLRARTGLSVAPRVVSKSAEAMVDLVDWTEKNVRGGWQNVIFDRHRLISEPIYGPLLREKTQRGFDSPDWFIQQLSEFYSINPVMIYCLPPLSICYSNVARDPDNKIVSNRVLYRQLWGAYYNKMNTELALSASTFHYDYTQDEDGSFAALLAHIVRNRIQR